MSEIEQKSKEQMSKRAKSEERMSERAKSKRANSQCWSLVSGFRFRENQHQLWGESPTPPGDFHIYFGCSIIPPNRLCGTEKGTGFVLANTNNKMCSKIKWHHSAAQGNHCLLKINKFG